MPKFVVTVRPFISGLLGLTFDRRRTRSSSYYLSGLGPEKVPLGSNGLANGYWSSSNGNMASTTLGSVGGQAASPPSVNAALSERFMGLARGEVPNSFSGEYWRWSLFSDMFEALATRDGRLKWSSRVYHDSSCSGYRV